MLGDFENKKLFFQSSWMKILAIKKYRHISVKSSPPTKEKDYKNLTHVNSNWYISVQSFYMFFINLL